MAKGINEPMGENIESGRRAFSLLTKSASDACTEYLRGKIISGELINGKAVVIDRIAADLGTSHTPVREAVRRLEAEGLVTYEPRRGVKVRGLFRTEFEELVELRSAIEPIALAKAISGAEPGAFEEADFELQRWTSAVGSSEMLSAQWKFLRAMYQPSGLTRTLEVIDNNWKLIERYHQHSWRTSDKVRSRDYRLKKDVLTHCRARNERDAVASLVAAIDWGAELAREGLSD